MDKFVSINPFEQVKTTVVTSMTVRVMRVELFKSATLHVTLMDSNRSIVESKVVEVNGDDYKQWGGDDTFIYQYIAGKLGFTMPVKGVAPTVTEVLPTVTEVLPTVTDVLPTVTDVLPTVTEVLPTVTEDSPITEDPVASEDTTVTE